MVWVLGAAILFWPAQPTNPLAIETYVEELSPEIARVSGPVLYTICGIPVMLIEPDGNGLIHYEGKAIDKRLQELDDFPIITNEITDGISMECRRVDGPYVPSPYRREPVPDIKDHIKEWSA